MLNLLHSIYNSSNLAGEIRNQFINQLKIRVMIDFSFNTNVVKFYTYRSAIVEASISIDLDSRDIQIISMFLKDNGYKIDNHICWSDDNGVCFFYSDRQLHIGSKIIERNW